ncbi:VOC family protein [Flocculibacter collagenilyticus]|uniref:VOC family protein n=1 Tax=Flocculibacter collagenilyticus TaxID=2744479 RepID=UPI0018F318C6|nr:VOC family protein [Flocculibacter collagenilyticus]
MYSDKLGGICWADLTTDNASEIRDFYQSVIGLESKGVDMTDDKGNKYQDYAMISPEDENAQTGVCHRKGCNSKIPNQWLVYFNVASIDDAVTACETQGGKVIDPPRAMGEKRMCVIQDPSGAYVGLIGA